MRKATYIINSMREFTAHTFLEPMKNGQIRPFLAGAKDTTGAEAQIVIKTKKGYEDTSGDLLPMFIEAFCLRFATQIGLRTVEPVVVHIPEGLEYGAIDFREYENERGIKINFYDLIQSSYGKNFGTVFLSNGWKTIPNGKRFISEKRDTANNILTYDALTQNTDRKVDNPNLLMKDHDLCLLDFDQAFSMGYRNQDPYPWLFSLQRITYSDHCLYPSLRPAKKGECYNQSFLDHLDSLNLEDLCEETVHEIQTHFPQANLDFPSLLGYIKKLDRHTTHFFQTLTQHLSS